MRPLLVALLVGLALRSHCLFFPWLWLDEFVTLWSIGGDSYGSMLARSLKWTASGPLFVIFYRLIADLFDNAELALKIPGVLCGTLTIWAAWWTTLRLFDRRDIANAAAWIVALAPQFVHFSQEGRPYMPAVLLITLSMGFLISWIRGNRWKDLYASGLLSACAVGFHLFAALAWVVQHVCVMGYGFLGNWHRPRWLQWGMAQLLVLASLTVVGGQFWMLRGRQSGMVLDTELPVLTKKLLDRDLSYEVRGEIGIVVAGIAIWVCARRLPRTRLGEVWGRQAQSVTFVTVCHVLPTAALSLLAYLRMVDCWPRYYFLFQMGLMVALAWLVTSPFPPALARCLALVIGLSMASQYNALAGVPSCRLNRSGEDWDEAERELRNRISANDLVLSRAGLIEANLGEFLVHPIGQSYLKCFLEAKNGPLPSEHIVLPFSPEGEVLSSYLDELIHNKIQNRQDFWLVNVGPGDFDYRGWLRDKVGNRFTVVEALEYSTIVISHFVRTPAPVSSVGIENKGTSDSVPVTVSEVPCQRSDL